MTSGRIALIGVKTNGKVPVQIYTILSVNTSMSRSPVLSVDPPGSDEAVHEGVFVSIWISNNYELVSQLSQDIESVVIIIIIFVIEDSLQLFDEVETSDGGGPLSSMNTTHHHHQGVVVVTT